MFAYMLSPQKLEPEAIDELLKKGWFRMREHMFTTHFLQFNNQFFSAIWLRVDLQKLQTEKEFISLQKKVQGFRLEIREARIDQRHEQLFAQYRQSIRFDTSDNLRQLLHGHDDTPYFQTYEINLYDGSTLAASGYFDTGRKSAAGIVSFYHPGYKKFSLGKYLIWCKLNWCKQQGLLHFYPGYTVPGYGMFDYKLAIGGSGMEYFCLGEQQWKRYGPNSFLTTPLQVMYEQLQMLQQHLREKGIRTKLFYYRYFDACLDSFFQGRTLLDFPVFLYWKYERPTHLHQLVVYDIIAMQFRMLDTSTMYQMESYDGSQNVFNSDLLQVERVIESLSKVDEVAAWLLATR